MDLAAALFPGFMARRRLAQAQLEHATRLYEAAKLSNLHRPRSISRSGNGVMDHARGKLRDLARDLDENHDLAVAILDDLVNKIVGTGIQIEPMVSLESGELDETVNDAIRDVLKRWGRSPEVTGCLPLDEVQRLACRTWLRDGELLIQHVVGRRSDLDYPSGIPYALEMLESDYIPYDLIDEARNIVHGVQLNAWGKPTGYYVYLRHPGDTFRASAIALNQPTKRISAEAATHLKWVRRFGQVRGTSIFHAVLNRLDDIKDYEESERIAARVAAAMCAYVKKSADFANLTPTSSTTGERYMEMVPGMIDTSLLPGEEIGTISHTRPSTQLEPFRNAMLRAAAAGTGATYSSVSRNYDGTYSAQRQEMVEASLNYARMRNLFVSCFLRPVYERLINVAILSGELSIPRTVDESLFNADFRGPSMPWIDPLKEVQADRERIDARIASRHQVIRERGGDPIAVDKQIERERANDPAPPVMVAPVEDAADDEQSDEEAA